MEHWLDKKFEDFQKTEKNISDEEKTQRENRIKSNFEKNKAAIDKFMVKLKELFNKLDFVKENGFEFYSEIKSMEGKPEFDQPQFSAENSTQHPTFLRRFCIAVSDTEDKVQVELYRGKRNSSDDPWKYHDEQRFLTDVSKLNEEHAYELIDWFAWKIYTPRGLR
jgi:hypothetical protein